jgi:hypothetical protein
VDERREEEMRGEERRSEKGGRKIEGAERGRLKKCK